MSTSKAPRAKVLIVDDEPDVHAVTRLSLKSIRHDEQRVQILTAASGAEAVEQMREHPDTAVVLLDVVMENDHAGLDACRAIRADNPFVRILLRTGQPGMAPERETIDEYDIDGYLPKAELTNNRLYVAVRTALRAFGQIVALEQHRRFLRTVHDCAVSMRSFEAIDVSLTRLLEASVLICPTDLAVLVLETFEEMGDPRKLTLHLASGKDDAEAQAAASRIAAQLARDAEAQARTEPGDWQGGYLVPLKLHRELGYGWLYMSGVSPGELEAKAFPLLAAHAQNALYSAVAERMLKAQQGPVFDAMTI